jgi:hypothetical protein
MRMLDQLLSFLVAFSLAFLVWLYARSRDQETLDNIPIPVQITLPASQSANFALEVSGPSQVLVSFTGPPPRIRELRALLQRGELAVDITTLVPEERQGESFFLDTVVIDSSDIHAPRGVTAVVMEGHNRIPITIQRLVEKRMQVRFDGSIEDRYNRVEADPPTVMVRGPQEVLERTRSIATVPYAISDHLHAAPSATSCQVGPVALVGELEGKQVRTVPSTVMLRVNVQSLRKNYDLEVPVRFLCPENFAFRPVFANEKEDRLNLKVTGPVSDEVPQVCAFIDLTQGQFGEGFNDAPIRLQLPKDFELGQKAPAPIGVKLLPAEPMTPALNKGGP